MLGRISQIVMVLLLIVVLGQENLKATKSKAQPYFVSPTGDNSNSGNEANPWKTVAYALTQLSAGDTLNLRAGTYYEHEIKVTTNGTASAPITIRSYPGEQAIIDGSLSNPITWEMVDPKINLYRSQQTFPIEEIDFVRGWIKNEDVQLVEYKSAANLESTNYGPLNGLEPRFVGPGLQLRNNGHIYIRLAYNPNDLIDVTGKTLSPTPIELNPNKHDIAVFFSKYLFLVDDASFLNIADLTFSHARYIMDVRNGSHDVTLNRSRLNYGTAGLVIREDEGVHSWEIINCEFNNGVPDYVYWTDVKNRDGDIVEAYPEFQSTAISGQTTGFDIHNNLFRDTFDGLRIEAGTTDSRIRHNTFRHIRDDAINLSRGISNVEVAHNMIWQVMGGIAILGSTLEPGQVYIHHNVIDNSVHQRGGRPGNYRSDNWPPWTIGKPFPEHDDGNRRAWWKLYNNTIVSRLDTGHRWAAAGPDEVSGNSEKYVYNNIFYIFDERVIFRNDQALLGSHYNGNVFYRHQPDALPLFTDFYDGGRFDNLAEFQRLTSAAWESAGMELDPGFDQAAINDPTFDPATIWERYRPNHFRIFTAGAPYGDLAWPETSEIDYRGAVPPNEQQKANRFFIYLPLQNRN